MSADPPNTDSNATADSDAVVGVASSADSAPKLRWLAALCAMFPIIVSIGYLTLGHITLLGAVGLALFILMYIAAGLAPMLVARRKGKTDKASWRIFAATLFAAQCVLFAFGWFWLWR